MAAPTKTAARKTASSTRTRSAAKKEDATPIRSSRSTRSTRSTRAGRVRGNSDANDAVLRAADQAKEDGKRTNITSEQAPAAPKTATKDEVKEWAEGISDQFLRCRDFGHQWRMTAPKRVGNTRERTMYCPSCKYNKHQVLDSAGTVIKETPDYPEGYLRKGLGPIVGDVKGLVRIIDIDRAIDAAEAKNRMKAVS